MIVGTLPLILKLQAFGTFRLLLKLQAFHINRQEIDTKRLNTSLDKPLSFISLSTIRESSLRIFRRMVNFFPLLVNILE